MMNARYVMNQDGEMQMVKSRFLSPTCPTRRSHVSLIYPRRQMAPQKRFGESWPFAGLPLPYKLGRTSWAMNLSKQLPS